MKGNELALIPILMFIFSIAGTTYGMLEETVGFYALLAAAMVMAGMDTVVSSAIVLLGAGSGVLDLLLIRLLLEQLLVLYLIM